MEHDLVDAFARGELHGVVLEQFRSRYLTNPQRLEATRFAEALQSLDETSRMGTFVGGGSRAGRCVREKWRWRNGWRLPPP